MKMNIILLGIKIHFIDDYQKWNQNFSIMQNKSEIEASFEAIVVEKRNTKTKSSNEGRIDMTEAKRLKQELKSTWIKGFKQDI